MKSQQLIGHITKCQICSHDGLETILPLGYHPPIHSHIDSKKIHEPEITYPLNLCRCPNCELLQLDYIGDPKVIFPPEYPYQTGLTNMLVRNFRSLADLLTEKYSLSSKDLVIDIGSNDGTLLQGFKDKGVKVLGVEPTDVAQIANKNGIETIQNYFDKETADAIIKKHGKAKIITATNVFAHINNIPELMRNIGEVLDKEGVFISESQYLVDIIEKLEFDTIYHEHLRFYSLKPLAKLFSLNGFTLVDAERITAAGGSIRAYAMKGERTQSEQVKELIAAEEKSGIYNISVLKKFADRVMQAKYNLVALLLNCKKAGARIVGLGAAGRSNTLLNFTKIDNTILDYNCEKKGSPKIGLFAPGSHIPIVDEEKLFQEQPEYLLVLSWHIGEELMKKIRQLGYKGKFIMPLPEPRIIEHI